MVFTLVVPNYYGYVVLGAGVGSFVTNIYLSGAVMKGRKELDVPYPNLYATPGVHKHADEFNRIQRSHQNFLEMLDSYIAMTLLGGLQYPIACAVGTVLFYAGAIFYQNGYKDTTLDVKMARYQKGGGIKWIGMLISLVSCGALGVNMIRA